MANDNNNRHNAYLAGLIILSLLVIGLTAAIFLVQQARQEREMESPQAPQNIQVFINEQTQQQQPQEKVKQEELKQEPESTQQQMNEEQNGVQTNKATKNGQKTPQNNTKELTNTQQ